VTQYTVTDAEVLVIAWLTPLGPTAFRRRADDPLPQRVVRRIAGTEDECAGSDNPIVSVHTFCDASDPVAALAECNRTLERMRELAQDPLSDIELLDGSKVNVDWLEAVEITGWVDYGDDSILHKIARYEFSLSYVAD
jgi:hypothetical protein